MAVLRNIHRILIGLFVLGAVSEFFFAGVGVFGADSFDVHRGIGNALIGLSLLLFLVALPLRQFIVHSGVLFLLMLLQYTLVHAGADASAWIAALHPLNGLAIIAAAGTLLRRSIGERSWAGARLPWAGRHRQAPA